MSERSTLDHLGAVLQLIADMHPGDRCAALDSAVNHYNLNSDVNNKYETRPSGMGLWRQLPIDGPLRASKDDIEKVLAKLSPEERHTLGYDQFTLDYYYK